MDITCPELFLFVSSSRRSLSLSSISGIFGKEKLRGLHKFAKTAAAA